MGENAAFLALACVAMALAGCSDDNGTPKAGMPGPARVDATDDTGGIRGVVVDQTITPIAGVNVTAIGAVTASATTDAAGLYVVSGLPAGSYIVKASHPFYDTVQQTVEVVAGLVDPAATNFQLTRVVAGTPYFLTQMYDGYIACSVTLGGGGYSEECGEGAGVPCTVPPPVGCQRVGGQEGNNIQFDFYVDGPHVRSLILEQVWDSTTGAAGSGELYTILATEWMCDPTCGGKEMGKAQSASPLYLHVGPDVLEPRNLTADTVVSAFTVAGGDEASVTLSQKYQLFVTAFYFAPAPETWSYVNDSPDPFQ